jgi:SAM-dependent methyltransferase
MAEERLSPASHDYVELLFHWHRYQMAGTRLQGLKVLDLGIGTAYGAAYLSGMASSLTGIDIDVQAVEEAKALYQAPHLTFLAGDLASQKFDGGTFDAVVMFEVIEHIAKDEQPALLQEIRRVLKPGGLLLMSTPDHERTPEFSEENPYHIGELTAEELDTLLSSEFAYSDIYSQEINAASIIWQAGLEKYQGYGMTVTDNGSHPAPVNQNKRLTLVAQSSNSPLDASLAGFCVETERKVLTDLWDHVGNAEWRVKTTEAQLSQKSQELVATVQELSAAAATISQLRAEKENTEQDLYQAKKDILIMSEDLLEIHASYQARLERMAELEYEAKDAAYLRHANTDMQEQLKVVYNSRSWRLIQRYWRLMDTPGAGPVLHGVRKVVLRTRRKSSPP